MADLNLKNMFVSSVLIGIFVFALFNFSINVASDNDLNTSIMDDNTMNESFDDFSSDLDSIKATAESQKTSFFEGIPVLEEVGIVVGGIVGVATTMFSFLTGLYDVIFELVSETLGMNNKIVFGAVTALLIFTIILLTWRVYRAGS